MAQLVINLPEGFLEELERSMETWELDLEDLSLEDLEELPEDLEEDYLVPPPPGSNLLEMLRFLVISQRVSLQQAQQLVDLYLTSTEPEFQVPRELWPMMQQVRLLEMDEARMLEQ
jgi:hypothetical protein